jgi:5,10-methylene-tetrahydrofolate dehydrogenase/methenyl tetrahydrofolate cyclohydrolase
MDMATVSILIVIVGCVIGLAEWVRMIKNDAGTMAAQIRTLETKIEHLEEQLDELKNDEELTKVIVQKAIEEKIVNEKIISLIQEKLKIQESVPPTIKK